MYNVAGIRFKKAGKIQYFDPMDYDLKADDYVIVESARGTEFGKVVRVMEGVDAADLVLPLKKVIRPASLEDLEQVEENRHDAHKAFDTCVKKVHEHKLDMKLVDVEYTFDRNKVIFYFTAEGRVDFRNLVKDLASIFRTRIELRQIGVRDEAKMLGGIGPCGRMLCCSTFLGDFEPVSIKMAKDQNLSLNPSKISGLCGRLMCCLKYENDEYEEAKSLMPDIGTRLETPDGPGKVVGLNLLERLLKVKLQDQDQTLEYAWEELSKKTGQPVN
ncbi:stage 0 sporulation protein [Sporosarcina sp. NCCP-2716]|uniref:PSP1 domain-containing protein n=1 Tax=Sporosarcina sp. NCCP-2716 TaxID=2943679 RepID=UPI00203A7ED2|nr:stage 0 sporulation family protein [Sporosarcina sp. NCCP-2716]GKV70401.1 stage 0 sporulation protein [Sporosarcina sp. NCCP-2716]